jgi:hypothetical protein
MACYVCHGEIKARSLIEQVGARRSLNVRVSIGAGLERHSYCAPGTERWMEAMRDGRQLSDRDAFYIRMFLEQEGS